MSNKKTRLIIFFALILWHFADGVSLNAENEAGSKMESRYASCGRRDPFMPLLTKDGRLIKIEEGDSQQELTLEGIIFDKNGLSYAIVNGEVVKIGDTISSCRILKIEKEKLIFIKDGDVRELPLNKEDE
jgi:hypothetical protein